MKFLLWLVGIQALLPTEYMILLVLVVADPFKTILPPEFGKLKLVVYFVPIAVIELPLPSIQATELPAVRNRIGLSEVKLLLPPTYR